ncbi:hypothetical protein L3Q82_025434 [Scortum barcoo]|uniref:Uncharacterized protein n=1 Tax=Scortum barcoo TaxID=214431 RepID=A0ACB8WN55_9TELE|nr:hypothetical protein L3Q82_025434 [Scortum barcoo]
MPAADCDIIHQQMDRCIPSHTSVSYNGDKPWFTVELFLRLQKKRYITNYKPILYNYKPRSIVLTSVGRKSFEYLLLTHCWTPAVCLQSQLFVDDSRNMVFFITTFSSTSLLYFSFAFNTAIPALLQDKLSQLGVPYSVHWLITDFLSNRRQHMKLRKHVSDSSTIVTCSPQVCILCLLLFSSQTVSPVISLSSSCSLQTTPLSVGSSLMWVKM